MEQYKNILIENKAIDRVALIDLVREEMKNKIELHEDNEIDQNSNQRFENESLK